MQGGWGWGGDQGEGESESESGSEREEGKVAWWAVGVCNTSVIMAASDSAGAGGAGG